MVNQILWLVRYVLSFDQLQIAISNIVMNHKDKSFWCLINPYPKNVFPFLGNRNFMGIKCSHLVRNILKQKLILYAFLNFIFSNWISFHLRERGFEIYNFPVISMWNIIILLSLYATIIKVKNKTFPFITYSDNKLSSASYLIRVRVYFGHPLTSDMAMRWHTFYE